MSQKPRDTVYPGEYKPLPFLRRDAAKTVRKSRKLKPASSIAEFPDHYKVQMDAPGHCSGEFMVHAHNKKLYIMTMHAESMPSGHTFQVQDFDQNCVVHTIDLPSNTDTDFIRAEYQLGKLCIYFPKNGKSVLTTPHRIVVY